MGLAPERDQEVEVKYFDWGSAEQFPCPTILDTSLREGMQGVLGRYPTLEEKLRLVELLLEVGVDAFDLGFPGADSDQQTQAQQLARYLAGRRVGARLVCLARARVEDVAAVVEVSQAAGVKLEVLIYIGTSSTRLLVEQSNIHDLVASTTLAVKFAGQHGLHVNFACQDATRSEPGLLRLLYTTALEGGAARLTLPDTVGVGNALSTTRLVKYVRDYVIRGRLVGLDWHGHNDRGLALSNALAAAAAGANCLHSTVLGIGERCGAVALEPLLLNLHHLCGQHYNLEALPRLAGYAAAILGEPLPPRQPLVGANAFAIVGGAQSEPILKAASLGRADLVSTIYSGVDPRLVGRATELQVGPLSNSTNVMWKATQLGFPFSQELATQVLAAARDRQRLLRDDELRDLAACLSQQPAEQV
ncbi:MAG: hypothetical protein AB1801_08990 [Chloroflexota bacterium]